MTAPEKIADAGLAVVVDALPHLKALYINDNQLTDAGLAAVPKLRSLEELNIGGGRFSNAGLAQLANLPSLQYLLLWGTLPTSAR